MVRVAVLVSGGGTNLQALIDACESNVIKSAELCLVISNKRDAYAIKRAQMHNIKHVVIEKGNFANKDDFEKAMINELQNNKIDLIVLAGFMCILSKNFTDKFPKRIINVHPSLIPSFCGDGFYGLRVHEKALEYGVKVSGATVHFVNEIADAGEIIMQKAVDVLSGDTPQTLQERIMKEAEWVILPKAVEFVAAQILKKELL